MLSAQTVHTMRSSCAKSADLYSLSTSQIKSVLFYGLLSTSIHSLYKACTPAFPQDFSVILQRWWSALPHHPQVPITMITK